MADKELVQYEVKDGVAIITLKDEPVKHPGLGDLYEFALGLEFGDFLGPTIAHASLQATDKLGHNLGYRTGVGHTGLYSLGDQLFAFGWVVAVPAT